MKRWTSALLAVLLALALTGCGEDLRQMLSDANTAATDYSGTPVETAAPEGEPDASGGDEAEAPPEAGESEAELPETGGGAPDSGTAAEAGGEAPEASDTRPEEDGVYDGRDDVALYLHTYAHLPSNYITKREARALGWNGGSLEPYAPGKCIGGDRFGNREGLLPEGHTYTECDIDTLGQDSRGAKRIVFSDDGLIYYTGDHYATFTLLYGEETP